MNIKEINHNLSSLSPTEIIEWALSTSTMPVLTTNFRPYEVCILHAVTQVSPDIDILWCDTGYNTRQTYKHALQVIDLLGLNIHTYVPKQSRAYRDVVLGIPEVDTPEHDLFTRQVKLEPFERAMADFNPDLWFTNLRKGQTVLRDSLDIVSGSQQLLKVSPFYHYTDAMLDEYVQKYKLPNEFTYFDPTKVIGNRECGLHNN